MIFLCKFGTFFNLVNFADYLLFSSVTIREINHFLRFESYQLSHDNRQETFWKISIVMQKLHVCIKFETINNDLLSQELRDIPRDITNLATSVARCVRIPILNGARRRC